MIFNSQGDAKLRQYINGGTITPGDTAITMPKGAQLLGDVTISAVDTTSTEITPGAEAQVITPPDGKYFNYVTVDGDADLIPEKIADGVNIFGVIGTHKSGVTGIDFGEVTLSAETYEVTVNHNLEVIPSFVALIPKELALLSGTSSFNINGKVGYYYSAARANITAAANTITETQITFKGYSSSYGFKASEYYWIAIV